MCTCRKHLIVFFLACVAFAEKLHVALYHTGNVLPVMHAAHCIETLKKHRKACGPCRLVSASGVLSRKSIERSAHLAPGLYVDLIIMVHCGTSSS